MSAWRVIVLALHQAGGGPLHRDASYLREDGAESRSGFDRARRLGLMTASNQGFVWRWTLTPLGRDFAEGRVTVSDSYGTVRGRSRQRMVATWLRALPADVRVAGGDA